MNNNLSPVFIQEMKKKAIYQKNTFWIDGCPVFFHGYTIYRWKEENSAKINNYASFLFRNLGTKNVIAIKAQITGFDTFGETVNTQEIRLTDFELSKGELIGESFFFELDSKTIALKLRIQSIVFSNSLQWNANSDDKIVDVNKISFDSYKWEQYQNELNHFWKFLGSDFDVKNPFQKFQKSWQCPCSQINLLSESTCCVCNVKLSQIDDVFNVSNAIDYKKKVDERIREQNRLEALEKEAKRKEKERLLALKIEREYQLTVTRKKMNSLQSFTLFSLIMSIGLVLLFWVNPIIFKTEWYYIFATSIIAITLFVFFLYRFYLFSYFNPSSHKKLKTSLFRIFLIAINSIVWVYILNNLIGDFAFLLLSSLLIIDSYIHLLRNYSINDKSEFAQLFWGTIPIILNIIFVIQGGI